MHGARGLLTNGVPLFRDGVRALVLVSLVACGDIKQGDEVPAPLPPGTEEPAPPEEKAETRPPAEPGKVDPPPSTALRVDVVKIVDGRSRVGARAEAGFRSWRGGLVATDDKVIWAESGASPGIYAAPHTGCTTACEKLATVVRPAVVASTATHLYVADVKVLKRMPLAGGALETVASSANEIIATAPVTDAVFWTTEKGEIQRTVLGGTTSTPIHSNGTPVGMGGTGTTVFWLGVDISGQQGLLQRILADGTKPRAISEQAGPFGAMGGSANGFFYFTRGNPAEVRRITPAGQEEVVASNLMRIADFAFDGEYAYWTEQGAAPDYLAGRVQRVRHDGTVVELLAANIPRPVALAVRGKKVFVASAGTEANGYADGSLLALTLSP